MAETPTAAPRHFGRYAILRELRRDRSSVTYLAADPVMHRELVLKTVELPPPIDQRDSSEADTSALEKAFTRQAQAAGRLQHPHIVTVFDAGRIHQTGYLAIERVSGRPLHELIVGGFRPEFVHCASIGARIADAIEYAHGQGVAHRHLGPQHVILQADGAPKIEGFGGWIDGGAAGEDALHRTERLLPYFDSELTEADRRDDVRAVAALVYMMLTGKAPAATPLPVKVHRPDVPEALAQPIDELLNPASKGGARTAADLRDALTAFIWNARKDNVAPGTIGIPLSAPPRAAPPQGVAQTRFERRAAPATLRIGGGPSTRPPTPHATRPGSAASTVAAAPARPGVRRPAAGPSTAATTWATLIDRLRPWLLAHRTLVVAAGALMAGGIVLGVVLGLSASGGGAASGTASGGVQAAAAPAAPVGEGVIRLDIAPWGEVFVDGRPIGVAPPMQELRLPAGRHHVEIRFGEKAAVSAHVTVDPAQPLQIRHRFE
jgi:hypothetical protein